MADERQCLPGAGEEPIWDISVFISYLLTAQIAGERKGRNPIAGGGVCLPGGVPVHLGWLVSQIYPVYISWSHLILLLEFNLICYRVCVHACLHMRVTSSVEVRGRPEVKEQLSRFSSSTDCSRDQACAVHQVKSHLACPGFCFKVLHSSG